MIIQDDTCPDYPWHGAVMTLTEDGYKCIVCGHDVDFDDEDFENEWEDDEC